MYYIILRAIKDARKIKIIANTMREINNYSFELSSADVLIFNTEEECLNYFNSKRDYWRCQGLLAVVAYTI